MNSKQVSLRLWQLTIFSWTLVFFLCAHLNAQDSGAGDLIFRGGTSHDFGLISFGSKPLTHVFRVKNVGQSEVKIKSVKATCKCLKLLSGRSAIKPGQLADFKVEFDPSGINHRLNQSILIQCKGAKQPNYRLSLTGRVQNVWATPNRLKLGSISTKMRPKRFVVYAGSFLDFDIVDVTSTSANFSAIESPINDLKDDYFSTGIMVNWQGNSPASLGVQQADIVVKFQSRHHSGSLVVPVLAEYSGALSCTPAIVNFGAVRTGKPVAKECTLRIAADRFGEIDAAEVTAESDDPRIEIAFDKELVDDEVVVRLRLKAESKGGGGKFQGQVTLRKEQQPICVFPFVGFDF